MNVFSYLNTAIIESQFDFSRIKESLQFSGEVMLSTTISIPKKPENNRIVVLTLDLSMGSNADKLQFRVKSRSFFEIENLDSPDTLRDDAQQLCYPKASEVLSEKIAEITQLHIGKAINIHIPQEY